ncbi:MAG: hypothetical protein RLZZ344_732 [Pseudomonadota bacterium]|jgi:hypothetical protein
MTTPTKEDDSQRVVETKKTKLGGFVGLILLLAFFTPYVLKLPQLDITLILIGGMALAIIDFFSAHRG